MAFLDETGLAELWSLIRTEDENVKTAITALLSTKANVATGSYTGTGKYGSSNKNSLTFDFVPKFLFVKSPSYVGNVVLWLYGDDLSIALNDNNSYYHKVTLNGNTISWYVAGNGNSDYYQCNSSGKLYNYIAIG